MGIQDGNLVFTIVVISLVLLVSGFSSVYATHVPIGLDTPLPWSVPDGFDDGYLEFINPTEHPGLVGMSFPSTPPGFIQTEEFTGYTLADGTDIIVIGADNDVTHGDKADFDWVQEHRMDEISAGAPVNHPGLVGALGWTMGTPEMSAHVEGTVPPQVAPLTLHGHSIAETPPGTLPELNNKACPGKFFEFVDVFSIISDGEDTDSGLTRNKALDYQVDFGNSVTGIFSPGSAVKVFVPGWTAVTTIDDYVARWAPDLPGTYDFVAIEPPFGFGHDEVTEIDAVKCYVTKRIVVGGEMMPIDTTAVLIAGIQTNASSIFGTFVVIGVIAFGALVISVKRKPN